MTAACVSCHDTAFAIGHAAGHVTGSGAAAVEGCVACHRNGLLQEVGYSIRRYGSLCSFQIRDGFESSGPSLIIGIRDRKIDSVQGT